jgi:cytochrome c
MDSSARGAMDMPSAPGLAAANGADGDSSRPAQAASGSTDPGDLSSQGTGSQGAASEPPGELPLAASAEPAPAAGSAGTSGETAQTPPPVVADPAPARLENVLVFTRTISFRHDSIGPGVEALRRLGQDNGFAVEQTEDPADFSDQNLARYDVVLWLSTDGDVLDDAGQRAFQRYIRAGGGWVGVHAASASEYGWAWYGELIGGGAYFLNHPPIQPARVQVEISDHPSTQHLPQSFTVQDELYSFRSNPRSSVRVLMTLDESSYAVGDLAMGDHPIAWYHEFEGGRAWYTALGHPSEWYADARFTRHLLGGIRWAAGVTPP